MSDSIKLKSPKEEEVYEYDLEMNKGVSIISIK